MEENDIKKRVKELETKVIELRSSIEDGPYDEVMKEIISLKSPQKEKVLRNFIKELETPPRPTTSSEELAYMISTLGTEIRDAIRELKVEIEKLAGKK